MCVVAVVLVVCVCVLRGYVTERSGEQGKESILYLLFINLCRQVLIIIMVLHFVLVLTHDRRAVKLILPTPVDNY